MIQSQGTVLHTELWWMQPDKHPHKQAHRSCSVVVKALAGLLEVAVAFLCQGESRLSQVLPVEDAAAQLFALSLGPRPLDSQQLDVAGQRDSPGSQVPGDVPPHCHWPEQTTEEVLQNVLYEKYQH